MKYAKDTTVTPARSLQEIKDTIGRYDGGSFLYFESATNVVIMFEMQKRRVRFVLPLPDKKDDEYKKILNANSYSRRLGEFSPEKYQQAIRQRWRALVLTIKAKLESVESGIETFDEAFMAQVMLPDGQTVGEWMSPQIDAAYLTAKMPPMLPSGSKP